MKYVLCHTKGAAGKRRMPFIWLRIWPRTALLLIDADPQETAAAT